MRAGKIENQITLLISSSREPIGYSMFDGFSWHQIPDTLSGLVSDAVLDMAVDNDNTLWCVCGGDSTHLCMFKKNIWTSIGG
jgi:hypothetical protein